MFLRSVLTDMRRHALLVAGTACWIALLYGLRFGYFEIEPEADPCFLDPGGLACGIRAALGMSIHWQVFGLGSLGAGVLGLALHGRLRRLVATAALLVSAAALVLYNACYGTPGAVIALLALAADPARD